MLDPYVDTKNDGGPSEGPPSDAEEEVRCVERRIRLLEPKKTQDQQYAGHEQIVDTRSTLGCSHRFLPESVIVRQRMFIYVKAAWPGSHQHDAYNYTSYPPVCR
jgi:hypothetical protein